MELNPNNLMSLKVTELRAELRKRGLQATGLKQALVDRLKENLLKEQAKAMEGEEEVEKAGVVHVQQREGEPPAPAESPPAKEVMSVGETKPEEKDIEVKDAPITPPEAPIGEVPLAEESPNEDASTPGAPPAPAPEAMEASYVAPSATEEEGPGENEPGEEEPGEKEPGEKEPGEKELGEKEPGEKEPGENEPEEKELGKNEPGENEPGENEPGEKEPGEKEPELTPVAEAARQPSPPPPAPEAMEDVSYKAPDATEKEPKPTLVAGETRQPSLPPPEALEKARGIEMESASVEHARQEPAAGPTKEDRPSEDSMNITIEAAGARAPIAAPADYTAASPHEASSEAPLITVVGEAMELDPAESLKRKRRSASPPSHTDPEGEPEPDTIPPFAKKQRAESPRRSRDARFKGLFNDAAPATEQEPEDEDEAPIEPSIHLATRALYIRNLVRPLQEHTLRSHVLSLATRNDEDPADALIETFYLDSIKSHALIVFESLAAANRVRVGIHNKVFPPEKTRKPLWVDFVPEENVPGWVEREKARGGGRWEVIYDTVGDEVTAEHMEAGMRGGGGWLASRMGNVGAGAGAGRNRGSIDISNAPLGPRGGSNAPPMARGVPAKGPIIMNLDQLFQSTRTKPKLYYLPVDENVARSRLAKQGRDSRGRL